MNNLSKNLKALMSAWGVGENELSRKTEVPQPTIHRIVTNAVADPRDGTLRPLATFFGVTVEELRTWPVADLLAKSEVFQSGQRVDVIDGTDGVQGEREVLIREADIVVSAGAGGMLPTFVDTQRRKAYQLNYILHDLKAKPDDLWVFTVFGRSMERTLFHGDKILVNTGMKTIEDGAVYMFAVGTVEGDSSVRVKRLFRTNDRRLKIVSDNDDKLEFPDEYIDAEEMENIVMIGQVVDKFGRGGLRL